MKIALVHQPLGFLSIPADGSIAIWNYEIARRLAQSCEVVVYARKGPGQKAAEWSEGVQYRRISTGLDDHALNFVDQHPRLGRLANVKRPLFASVLAHLEYGLKVAMDLRKRHCDLVQVSNFSQLVPVVRALNPGVRIALHMQCQWLTRFDRAMIGQRLKKADLITGCSEHVTEKVRRAFPKFADRCRTVFNGVDVGRFLPDTHRSTRQNGAKRILWVGRISPEKGVHVLIDAFGEVVKHYPQAQLEITGPKSQQLTLEVLLTCDDAESIGFLASFYDGKSYFSHLQERVASLNLGSRITFSGPVPHVDTASRYRSADVLANPSFTEAFGMTTAEAMACQVPVVATRVGGMTEVVENGKSGILVEPGNAHALAEAILRLLADDDLREAMGRAGRRRVVEHFTWDQIAQGLLGQYREICQAHN